jgi:hypothetical protein
MAVAALYLPGRFLVIIYVRGWVIPRARWVWNDWVKWKRTFNDLTGIRSNDLPACSIEHQPTTLPRAPELITD